MKNVRLSNRVKSIIVWETLGESMIKETYGKIVNNQDVRKNLIELRKTIKDYNNRRAFLHELNEDYSVLYKLLEDEDAKVRKNIALIMGELGIPEFMDKLYEAYEKEEKLFVKSDYLTALSFFDYLPLVGQFKVRLNELTQNTWDASSKKHINEEIRILTSLLLKVEEPKAHPFNGYREMTDLILLTNREHQEITVNQITKGKAKAFGAGVLVRTDDLKEILKIRTYKELLFKLKDVSTTEQDPVEAARTLIEGGLLDFLNERHKGYPPYYFRIEMKTKMPLDKKSIFAKKMAAQIEELTQRQLINSTSHYEFEIRLIENKEGRFNVLLKLYTIEDRRFDYRKNTIAVSITPSHAALITQLAKNYLKEDAQVLDPFCGVGTMLIERNKIVPAKVMYGVDIFGEAIDGAIENSNWADTDIYLINRDFFDFTHKYLFDEIYTNMPTVTGRKTEQEISLLYDKFFEKAVEMLEDQGIIVLYTRDKELVERGLMENDAYTVLENYEISRKEGAYLYILQVKK